MLKTTLAALVLAALPTLSFAMGCHGSAHTEASMSCAEGSTWDATSQTCVPKSTS